MSKQTTLAGLMALLAGLATSPAMAFDRYLVVPDAALAERSPAFRYANMSDSAALAELDRRSISYAKVDTAPGVRAPIRLTGALHGVSIHMSLPANQRAVSPFEILDARLALALDDFTVVLARHGIDELVHYDMYRPNGTGHSNPAPPGTRHPAGLAIDVAKLHKKDGAWLDVRSDFRGHIGDKTCGTGAVAPESPRALELRTIICEAGTSGIFTYVLTPDYDAAHVDHMHMEIKPGVRWFLYH